MKKKFVKGIILLGCVFAFQGCAKENAASGSRTQLLTQKTWKLTGETLQKDGGALTDVYTGGQSCAKDNIITFTTGGTYITEEGPTKCNMSDPQVIQTGTWVFTNNETNIVTNIFDASSSPGVCNITVLDANTLILSVEFTSGTHLYHIIATFGH